MNDVLEKVQAGIVCLYGSFTRREFHENLGMFLAEVFREPLFTVVTQGSRPDRFHVEYSNISESGSGEATFVSEPLAEVLGRRGSRQFSAREAMDIPLGATTVPVRAVVALDEMDEGRSALLLHSGLDIDGEEEELFGIESFVLDHVAMAFQKVRERDVLRDELDLSLTRLDAIQRISGCLETLDLDVLLSQVMEVCLLLTDAQVSSIRLRDPISTEVEWGLPSVLLDGLVDREGRSVVEEAMETGEALLISDLDDNPDYHALPLFHVHSFLCVPLTARGRVLGTIQVVKGRDADAPLSRRDLLTMSTLSNLVGTALENAILHRESLAKQKIEANLQIARTIQQRMYPTGKFDLPGYDVAWINQSCDETGGDYFDVIPTADGDVVLAMGDVSGHGIGAAMLMATGRANLRALLSVREDPREVMERLNNLLERDMDIEKFMTLFLGKLDPRAHQLSYVNAGHDCPLVWREATARVETLQSCGLPVGMFPDREYEPVFYGALDPGDAILMTTDGVWEATDAAGTLYGKERLGELFGRLARRPAAEVIDAILEDVGSHCGSVPKRDDLTLLVLRREPVLPGD